MDPDRHEKDLDKLISASIGRENLTFDFETWKQAHRKEVQIYESQAAQAPRAPGGAQRPAQPHRIWKMIAKNPISRLAAAAVIVIAALAAIRQLVGSVGVATPAWADVAESFRSVPFFSAAIYIKEDVAAEPKQIELWMSRDGRTRMRTGTQVVFGDQGKVTKAYDIKTHSSKVEVDERVSFLLQKLGSAKEFSLDSVIKVVFAGKLEDVTPLINPDAVISRDMVVFDIQSTISPEWLRIWALRESRLPVRIKVWDPRSGDGTDVVFSYSKEQSDKFFDPNAFASLLFSRQASSSVNLAYAYLKDPGGRQITPEDMFAESGFHIPEIVQVGITPEGAVWVIADKGHVRMPQGGVSYGFAEIEDDLGREYRRVYASHRVATDQSMDVFVPIGYPFDANAPGKITLSCRIDGYSGPMSEPDEKVELTEWQQDKMWPEGTIKSSVQNLATTLAQKHVEDRRYAEAERILATIQGAPEDDSAALTRERIRLRMLVGREKYAEAVNLGQRLMPVLEENYRRWKGYASNPTDFTDYLVTLAAVGKAEEVGRLWRKIKAIEPEIPDRLNKAARQHIEEDIEQGFVSAARIVVPRLSREAHLTVEQINEILGIDIKNDETFKHYHFWDWNPEFEKPKYKNWERHLGELAEHYKKHPLPEKMELLKQDTKQEYGVRFLKMPGIETHYAEPLRGKLWDYARFYKYPESAGRLRIEADIADIELGHDIVYKTETTQPERIEFVLDRFGLEVIEVNEPRQVWIAHYDGRELKDYKQVKAPVPYYNSGTRKAGMMTSMASAGFDLSYLFRTFTDDQNRNAKADGIIVVDQTGLADKVSLEGPCFAGPEGAEMARKWFKDEIGVTFAEQTRNMTTYIIRKRQAPRRDN
jgi:hypothetical protein